MMVETTTKVPRTQPRRPPLEELPIRDVPVPPDGWTPVVGRRQRRTYAEAASRASAPPGRGRPSAPRRPTSGNRDDSSTRQPVRPKKPPKTAAVQVTCPPGQYAETMRLARERVNLRGLGIGELKPRRARTGALLLEIPGGDGTIRADALARELREALNDREGVRITRPIKTAELRVKDLEDSVSAAEIAEAIADQGQCEIGDIRVGPIRAGPNRLGTAWLRCPLIAVNRILRGRRLTIGWTKVRFDLLPDRPTTCYRCLRKGHVRATCPENADNEGLCYRCGEPGHLANTCTAPPRCPLCRDSGRPDNHRVGSEACRAPKRGGGGRKREAARTQTQTRTQMRTSALQTPSIRNAEPEPMEVDPPRPTPSQPPRSPGWPAVGEKWSPERPLPSRRGEPITGRGPPSTPVPLPPSQPELITGGERLLSRRLKLVPVMTHGAAGATDPSDVPRIPSPPPPYTAQVQERLEGMRTMCGELVWELREFSTSEEERDTGGPLENADPGVPAEEPGSRAGQEEEEMGEPPADADVGARPTEDPVQAVLAEEEEAPGTDRVSIEDGCPNDSN